MLRQLTPVLQCNYRSVPSAHDTQWSLAEIYFGAKTQFIVTEAVFGAVYELRGVLELARRANRGLPFGPALRLPVGQHLQTGQHCG